MDRWLKRLEIQNNEMCSHNLCWTCHFKWFLRMNGFELLYMDLGRWTNISNDHTMTKKLSN